jgi:hypothetical protein
MSTCRLIVFERSIHWAAALRRTLRGPSPRIVEVRSLAGAKIALIESPCSLVALETAGTNVEAVLDFLTTDMAQFPQARTVALLAADARRAEPLLREAGAIDVLTSVLDVERLARAAERQMAQAPPKELTIRELVRERMPWPAQASSDA